MSRVCILAGLALLAMVAVPTVAQGADESPAIDTVEEFLARADSIVAERDARQLDELVGAHRALTFKAVDELIERRNPESTQRALSLARSYRSRFDDSRLLKRVETFRDWSPREWDERATAMATKDRGIALFENGKFDAAIELFSETQDILERLGDRVQQAYSRMNIGACYLQQGRIELALENFDAASAVAELSGYPEQQAYIDYNRAYVYDEIGEATKARRIIKKTLPISQQTGDVLLESAMWNMLGAIELSRRDFVRATEALERGLELGRTLANPDLVSTALSNLAAIAALLGDVDLAIERYWEAIAVAKEAGRPQGVVRTSNNLLLLLLEYNQPGDIEKVMALSEHAVQGIESPELQALVLLNRALVHQDKGAYLEVIDLVDRALVLLEDVGTPRYRIVAHGLRVAALHYSDDFIGSHRATLDRHRAALESGDPVLIGESLRDSAMLLMFVGEHEQALAKLSEAIKIQREAKDTLNLARSMQIVGLLRLRLGDVAAATEALTEAIEVWPQPQRPREYAELRLDYGDLQRERGAASPESIADTVGEVVAMARRVDDTYLWIHGLLLLAELRLDDNDAAGAIALLAQAAAIPDEGQSSRQTWRLHYLQGRALLMKGDVQRSEKLFREAIEQVERVRVRADRMHWRAALLQDRLAPYHALLRLKIDQELPDEAYRIVRMIKARSILDQIVEGAIRGQPASTKRLRAALGSRQAIVDYVALEDEWITFVVRPRGVTIFRNAMEPTRLGAWLDSAGFPGLPDSADAAVTSAFWTAMDELGSALIGDIQGALTGVDHLLVVPNGLLANLPFAALRVDRVPLIERYDVSMLPAADLILVDRAGDGESAPRALVVGDPNTNGDRRPLPGARQEAQRIAAALGERTELLVGSDARESRVVERGPLATLVHIAAHGELDGRVPTDTALLLTSDDDHDGRLSAAEIAGQKWQAELIVLSGCGTARNSVLVQDRSSGDEREGLVHAFLRSGARALVATRWDIEDRSATVIFERLYAHLENYGAVRALSMLQREMLRGELRGPGGRDFSHPHDWAAIVGYGNETLPLRGLLRDSAR